MINQSKTINKEQGVVSILSVIFFIILMTVITISFLRVVTDEQEQVIQNDLSKGALAAAQSGVEDAKRALLYCRADLEAPGCDKINEQECPGMFSGTNMPLLNAIGLNNNRLPEDGSIRVGDPNNNNNQRYTCVTMTRDTPNYEGQMSEGLGDFIPLRGTRPNLTAVRISWHQPSATIDGAAAVPPAGAISLNTNPAKPDWQSPAGVPYIAMPRLQLVQFDPDKRLSEQRDSSSGTFLVPYAGGGGDSSVDVTSVSAAGMPKRAGINCSNPGPQSGFMCTATLNFGSDVDTTKQLFLLVKSQYGTPHYMIELLDEDGVIIPFKDVQPQVDSTGAAANVFKRIRSRIAYVSDTYFTSNALESGLSICKNFFITRDAYNSECSSNGLGATGGAEIGGYCHINICISTPRNTDNNGSVRTPVWAVTMVNFSNYPQDAIAGCEWDFGDGTKSNDNCTYLDTFSHTFPRDEAYDTDKSLPRKSYVVKLVIKFKDGTESAPGTRGFYLPENYP